MNAETPQSVWPDIVRYADTLGLGDQARGKWSKEKKVPNLYRAAICSQALNEGRHVPDQFFTVFKARRPQVAPLKP